MTKIIDKLKEYYDVLKTVQVYYDLSKLSSEKKRIYAQERELSDLLDMGSATVPEVDERKYVHIEYTFNLICKINDLKQNSYVPVRESYKYNDNYYEKDPRVPEEAVPERMFPDPKYGGNSHIKMDWYVGKETIRTFGFTLDSFKYAFFKRGNVTGIDSYIMDEHGRIQKKIMIRGGINIKYDQRTYGEEFF